MTDTPNPVPKTLQQAADEVSPERFNELMDKLAEAFQADDPDEGEKEFEAWVAQQPDADKLGLALAHALLTEPASGKPTPDA